MRQWTRGRETECTACVSKLFAYIVDDRDVAASDEQRDASVVQCLEHYGHLRAHRLETVVPRREEQTAQRRHDEDSQRPAWQVEVQLHVLLPRGTTAPLLVLERAVDVLEAEGGGRMRSSSEL